MLFGVLLDAFAELGIRHLKLGRGVAVVLAAILFLLCLGGVCALIATPLLRQASQLVHSLPEKTERFSRELEHYRNEFPMLKRVLPVGNAPAQNQASPELAQAAKKALVTASGALEGFARALATFFFGIFLAWNPERWIRGIAELWPPAFVEERVALFHSIGMALRSYLFTVGISMVGMALGWTLGLWLIGIQFPLLFGAIGGVVEIVPYVGPLLGFIPPFLYALSTGGMQAIYVLLVYSVLHILEAYVLVPFVLQKREQFPPPLVVLSILLGGALFGGLGVVLAVPMGTTVYVWLQKTVYKSRRQRRD
jgi:predicted PurR-regulated permease PerM